MTEQELLEMERMDDVWEFLESEALEKVLEVLDGLPGSSQFSVLNKAVAVLVRRKEEQQQ